MISGAIAEILSVSDITDIVNDISPYLTPQNTDAPYIVITEQTTPELYKGGYKVVTHEALVHIYASKGKDGNGGFLQAQTIANLCKSQLLYYSGTADGHAIQTITLENEQPLFDNVSQEAIIILDIRVRENI